MPQGGSICQLFLRHVVPVQLAGQRLMSGLMGTTTHSNRDKLMVQLQLAPQFK